MTRASSSYSGGHAWHRRRVGGNVLLTTHDGARLPVERAMDLLLEQVLIFQPNTGRETVEPPVATKEIAPWHDQVSVRLEQDFFPSVFVKRAAYREIEDRFLISPLLPICGYAGTGKSTILRKIYNDYLEVPNRLIAYIDVGVHAQVFLPDRAGEAEVRKQSVAALIYRQFSNHHEVISLDEKAMNAFRAFRITGAVNREYVIVEEALTQGAVAKTIQERRAHYEKTLESRQDLVEKEREIWGKTDDITRLQLFVNFLSTLGKSCHIIIDNLDRLRREHQDQVFSLARDLTNGSALKVAIAIRSDNFSRLPNPTYQAAVEIPVYMIEKIGQDEVVSSSEIEPSPDVLKIICSRLHYAGRLVAENQELRTSMAKYLASDRSIEFDPNLRLLAQDTIRLSEVLVHRTLGADIRTTVIGPLSIWHNSSIRSIAHSFFRIAASLVLRAKVDSLRSEHSFVSFESHLSQVSVRALRNALYREAMTGPTNKMEILNIFDEGDVDGELPYCLFPLKILQLLIGRHTLSRYAHHAAERSVRLRDLTDELGRLGIEEEAVKKALRLLEEPRSNNPYGLVVTQGHATENGAESAEENEKRVHLLPSGAMFWMFVSTSCEYLYSCAIEHRGFSIRRRRELESVGALARHSRPADLANISPHLLRVSVASLFLEDEVLPTYQREADALRAAARTQHAAAGRSYVRYFGLKSYQDLYVARCVRSLRFYLGSCSESDRKQPEYRITLQRLGELEQKAAQFDGLLRTLAGR
jgi:hypothetical protein